ncbi:MAG: hypothetical protein II008_19605 [Oscillospiraceae bacterium]|nr:hypothetical protein [Oscillospiraceae bacterium]
MTDRSFDEMIAYFNRRVADMDIGQDYKMELLGMVTALGYKHEKSAQERKTGKWIEDRVIPDAYDITGVKTWASVMRCDNCGFTMFSIEGHMGQYNYCPDCGAKMS